MLLARKCKKRRYPDETAAMLALASAPNRQRTVKEEKRYYRCPKCKGLHLTSKP